MANQANAKPSIFVNTAAWALLLLVLLSGVVALFSAAGVAPQELKVSKLELRTTSTATIVMVLASLPLWTILHYGLKGKIRLYDDAANPPAPWLEKHAEGLEIVAAAVGLIGAGALIWFRLRG